MKAAIEILDAPDLGGIEFKLVVDGETINTIDQIESLDVNHPVLQITLALWLGLVGAATGEEDTEEE